MNSLRRLSRFPVAGKHLTQPKHKPILNPSFPAKNTCYYSQASWLAGLRKKTKVVVELPGIVQGGHPVLHEPAKEVLAEEIGSGRLQKIIDDMVMVMRTRPGVGLAAPQIGISKKVSPLFFVSILAA
ncbi:peptide deformylase 1A, chloroplastic-like protein [Tanacetum coccineum]